MSKLALKVAQTKQKNTLNKEIIVILAIKGLTRETLMVMICHVAIQIVIVTCFTVLCAGTIWYIGEPMVSNNDD